jgi:hypothetical protein
MMATGHDIQSMLSRLEALLSSGVLTQAETVSCSGLAEALRRPARVAILGQSARDVTGVLGAMLGDGLVTVQPDGPAMELRHGEVVKHIATFEDGSSLNQDGYPNDNLMRHAPLFLQIEAPLPMLATMSFLALELGEDHESYAPALRWAAKRSEIAILCAEGFGDPEAALWAAAPDRLKNHCYLVTTGGRDPASARARGLFDAVVHAPDPSESSPPLTVLKKRLATDISDARQEDIDAAALFLHRFREADLSAPLSSAFDEARWSAAEPEAAPGRDDRAGRPVAPTADVSPHPAAADRAPNLADRARANAFAPAEPAPAEPAAVQRPDRAGPWRRAEERSGDCIGAPERDRDRYGRHSGGSAKDRVRAYPAPQAAQSCARGDPGVARGRRELVRRGADPLRGNRGMAA